MKFFKVVKLTLLALFLASSVGASSGAAQTEINPSQIRGGVYSGDNSFAGTNNFIGSLNAYADTGETNAYVITTSPITTSILSGFEACFIANHANTGASTLQVNSIAAKAITKNQGTLALVSNDIQAAGIVCVKYDGTQFEMIGQLGNAAVTVPGGSDTCVQINKSSTFGCVTDFGLDSSTSPTQLNVPFNSAVAGPRPYIDVTSSTYGALGNGSHDDGPAIQAAINASCANDIGGGNGHPDVFFPPGIYKYTRSATANTPDFTVGCSGIRFLGGGNSFGSSDSTVTFQALNCPGTNAAPDFLIYNVGNIILQNINIIGCNEALAVEDFAKISLFNVSLDAGTITSQADNTPLKLTNGIEFKWFGGEDDGVVGSYTLPSILFTDEVPFGIGQYDVSLVDIENLWMGGGPVQYIKRQAQSVGTLTFTFRNDLLEGAQDFFEAMNDGANSGFGNMIFDNINLADPVTGGGAIFAEIPSGGDYVSASGIEETQPIGANAIRMTDDTHAFLGSYTINGCNQCGAGVVDTTNVSSGVPTGNGTTQENQGGYDHISNAYNALYGYFAPTASTSLFPYQNPTANEQMNYPADRWCLAQSSVCTMALDANWGELFGDGTTNGFSSGFHSTAPNTLNMQFATVLPPTTFAGSATTGGTLAANTYYGTIWATTYAAGPNCQGGGLQSTFAYTSAITVGGSNNAIAYTWVDPPAALSGTIQGYCIQTFTNGPGQAYGPGDFAIEYIYVSGAGTTSYTYTGASQTSASPFIYPQSPMADFLQISPKGIALIGTPGVGAITICSNVQLAFAGGSISAGSDIAASSTCTGVATSAPFDRVTCNAGATDWTGIMGFVPSSGGGILSVYPPVVSANTITLTIANNTPNPITLGAVTVYCGATR